MKRTALWGVLIALTASTASGQETPEPRKNAANQKRVGTAYKPWMGYNKAGTVQWTEDVEEAFTKAAKENKLVMILNLVGEMKFKGC